MAQNVVFTLTGPDRVGIVEQVTGELLALDANIETSRMVRLGGEFAMLMLVSLPDSADAGLDEAVNRLSSAGYRISTTTTAPETAPASAARVYRIEVTGADHEGIIRDIAGGLASRGINIESADTSTVEAPMSGTPLFRMTALVQVPAELTDATWMDELDSAASQANVDVEISLAD